MTREERKKAIKVLDDMKVKIDVPKAAKMQNDKNWALDVAIKALEQEPCTDAVSREAVIEVIYDSKPSFTNDFAQGFFTDKIRDLPSVTPQKPKYCDRNICLKNEYNGIGCDECEVTKSQDPCDDAISREYLKKIAQSEGAYGYVSAYDIATAPSITQKSGKWIVGRISPTKLRGENLIEYRCSECDREIRCTESQLVNYPYCHCGAKMESEDKE